MLSPITTLSAKTLDAVGALSTGFSTAMTGLPAFSASRNFLARPASEMAPTTSASKPAAMQSSNWESCRGRFS